MQDNPPFQGESGETPTSAHNEQEDPTLQNPLNTYIEPEYKEYVPADAPRNSEQPVPAPPGPLAPVTQNAPRTPQPGYGPRMFPPGNYIPPTPQPGYIPPTPQPGYVPPGYAPPQWQPGYPSPFPPQQPTPGPNRWSPLAIISVVVGVVLLLAVVFGAISLARQGQGSPNTNTGTPVPQVTSAPTTAPGHPTSAFQVASCPFHVGAGLTEGQQVSCGYVSVPENRSARNSATVKLAVAIFKATQFMNPGTVDPDPVIRLDGGPGGPSLNNLGVVINAANYSQFVFTHNLILFDQRGTGYSTPSLQCPELIALQDASMAGKGQQTYEQAARTCHDRLVSAGIDLNGFNTLQDAADVVDVIHALGYKQMTVYGVSYGTRLALTVMHLYPSAVHAAVLDSVYPTNHNRTDLPSDAQRVFNVLFQGCAKDANCNAKYPNLQSVFYSLVDQFNAHPIIFNTTDLNTGESHTVTLAGKDFVSWLFTSLYPTSVIPLLPEAIYQVKAHNYQLFSRIYGALVYDNTFSDGMFYSSECSEDWPFLTQQDITRSVQGITPQIAAVFGQDEQQEYDICQFWKVQPLPASQKQPVISNLPALVLSGEYDPITPPSNGQEVSHDLSHSYYFIFPGQGHGEEYSSDCSNQIISAFEDNSNQQPDNSCISQMSEPAFQ
jgi:pimeloyl-ACP methyl ester carboxylesterase